MDDRETATAREGGQTLERGENAEPRVGRLTVGRASVPTVSPVSPAVDRTALSRPDADLPSRIPGQTRTGLDSPWTAFSPPRQEAPVEERPDSPAEEQPESSVEERPAPIPEQVSAVVRARASVPGAAALAATDLMDEVQQRVWEPGTYRAGAIETTEQAPAEPPPPAEPPAPPQPREPVSPPEPPSPPQPVSPPEPPSPPQPIEPPPGPSPFPAPTPVPAPPHPVPPEPPVPQPEPGPPYPPQPPVPAPPTPPGPAPVPPFPPPPPAIAEAGWESDRGSQPGAGRQPISGSPPEPGRQPGGVAEPSLPVWPSPMSHPHGTVYGSSTAARPLEYSGSLTGHILSQGADTPPPKSRTTRVVVIMTIVMTTLVIAGLTIAVFARNALLNMLTGG